MAESAATPDLSPGGRTPLTLEDYATISAHLVHYPEARRADVLERLDVEASELTNAGTRWRAEIKRRILDDDPGPVDAFNDAFLETKRRLQRERPEIEAILPLRPKVTTAPAAPPLIEAATPPVEAPAPPQPLGAQPLGVAPPPIAPIAPATPTFVAEMAKPATPRTRPSALAGTSLALDVPRGPATPFIAANAAEPPRATSTPGLPPVVRSPLASTGTSLALDVPRRPATPFTAAEPPRTVATPGLPPVVRSPLASTGTSLALDVPRGPATPFTEAGAGDPPHTPSEAPARALTLEQYASLCVELERSPARTGEVLARYGLTHTEKAALDQYYRTFFAQRPESWQSFQRARASYEAWLASTQQAKR
jgi:hypothetical protein